MKLRCIFGHQMMGFSVHHYLDATLAVKGSKGAPSTRLTSRCVRCGAFRGEDLYGAGHIPLEAFLLTEPGKKSSTAADATRSLLARLQKQSVD